MSMIFLGNPGPNNPTLFQSDTWKDFPFLSVVATIAAIIGYVVVWFTLNMVFGHCPSFWDFIWQSALFVGFIGLVVGA